MKQEIIIILIVETRCLRKLSDRFWRGSYSESKNIHPFHPGLHAVTATSVLTLHQIERVLVDRISRASLRTYYGVITRTVCTDLAEDSRSFLLRIVFYGRSGPGITEQLVRFFVCGFTRISREDKRTAHIHSGLEQRHGRSDAVYPSGASERYILTQTLFSESELAMQHA